MVIQSYGGFKRMVGFCKSRVPPSLWETLDAVKVREPQRCERTPPLTRPPMLQDDEAKVKEAGAAVGTAMSRRLLESGTTTGLHFYSLNMEGVTYAILKNLGLLKAIRGADGEMALPEGFA